MPLEIKRHTVPHLKSLTRSIECRGEHGHSSTFKQCYTVMKSTVFIHKWPKLWFHLTVAVLSKAIKEGKEVKIGQKFVNTVYERPQ